MPALPPIESLTDIELLREAYDLECKLAAGIDGRGKLPADFWETYSSFANTVGGVILLGIAEKNRKFELAGLADPGKLRTELFDLVNNRQKISANLINDSDVIECDVAGRKILAVWVPQATRKHRPVFVGGNPLKGTFRRQNDGDRLCDEETVKRMLSEQVEDSRDNRILKGYEFSDIDPESLRIYRQMLKDRSSTHPFLEDQGVEFLRKIGAWRKDRETGQEGLTVAGLLMFGRDHSIRDEFPYFTVDYQERSVARAELRWVDRLTNDGTWSGNVFDFFRRVYRKLVTDLKVPFRLQEGQRQDDTPVHTALREALVNTLAHADYSGRASILVVKRPDMFGFRNPGRMRISVEQAVAGGESDGRNRTIQQMFLLIGAGERSGSGVPKIYSGWAEGNWRPPLLYEKDEPSDQTLLELRMTDLLPKDVLAALQATFGEAWTKLDRTDQLILATAKIEGTVNHARVLGMSSEHPNDITRRLGRLVSQGLLLAAGRGRGSVYYLVGSALPTADGVFGAQGSELIRKGSDLSSEGTELSSEPLVKSTGRIVEGLSHPLIEQLSVLEDEIVKDLHSLAAPAQQAKKLASEKLREIVLQLCTERYLTLRILAELLKRDENYLRIRVLNPLVDAGILVRAFPANPNDPRQAYRTDS